MLHISRHLGRALTAAVTTTAILGAGLATAAQAAPTFSPTGTVTTANVGPSPTISLTKPGTPSVTLTCPTLKPGGGFTYNTGTPANGVWAGANMSQRPCTGSNGFSYDVSLTSGSNQFALSAAGGSFAVASATAPVFTISGGPMAVGQGSMTVPAYSVAWTNGSGATASAVSLSNFLLGTTWSSNYTLTNWTVRITGRWTITTAAGGLITALP